MSHPSFSESDRPMSGIRRRNADAETKEPFQHHLKPLNRIQDKTREMIMSALEKGDERAVEMLMKSFNQTHFHDVSKETQVSIDGLTEGPVDKYEDAELWLRRTKATADFRFVKNGG